MRIRMTKCRFCGGDDFIEGYQTGQAVVFSSESLFRSQMLYHTICRKCGSVVKSYVRAPEKMLKKKNRNGT